MRRLTFPLTVLWSSPFCWIPPMYVLTVGCVRCRRFQWPPASHCHIIPAPLTLSILLGFLLTSDRVRVKGIDQKKKKLEEQEVWWKSESSTEIVSKYWNLQIWTIDVCVAWRSHGELHWEQLICTLLLRKGCVTGFSMFLSVTMKDDAVVIFEVFQPPGGSSNGELYQH